MRETAVEQSLEIRPRASLSVIIMLWSQSTDHKGKLNISSVRRSNYKLQLPENKHIQSLHCYWAQNAY